MTRNLYRIFLIIGATIVLTFAVPPDGSRAADDSRITIAYSGNMMGYMEPCG